MSQASGDGAFLDEEREMVNAVAAHIERMLHGRLIAERLVQSEKLNAVGQLTGGVAHDFNNLLTVILGNAEALALELGGDEERRRLAQLIVDVAERGAALTHRLLAFARRQPLDPKPTDIGRLIAGMDRLLRRTLGGPVEIEIRPSGDLWMAMIDAGQLENAIINLCINARDAMPDGGRLTIETANVVLDSDYAARHSEVTPGEYVAVTVSDSGTGMDEETLGRVFEPFFTTKEVGKGSGLGLSMVYGFVKQSKGHVRILSAPAGGTRVTLYLPRAVVRGRADESAVGEIALTGGSERILVVEDDDLVRAHVLEQLGRLAADIGRAELTLLQKPYRRQDLAARFAPR